MALASRPKRSTHYKKSRARHHRHSKSYVKTYWPYLPMLFIMAGGVLIDRGWRSQSVNEQAGAGASAALGGQSLEASRLAALTGIDAAWLASLVAVLAVTALAWFMLQNGRRLHHAVVKSEHYVSKHPLLDVAAVFIFTAGLVLIKT